MGFAPERVDWALSSTNGTLEAALDHLEAHQDEPVPEVTDMSQAQPVEQSTEPANAAVNVRCSYLFESIQCSTCDKRFRDMDMAMYHADKSGHEDFSESTEAIQPLSPEEKEKRLAECTLFLIFYTSA